MKKTATIFLMLLTVILLNTTLFGQDKKNSLTVGGIATSYISVEDQVYNWDRHEGYHRSQKPGVELVYMRTIFGGFELGTGIN